jgi:hypothetical protein
MAAMPRHRTLLLAIALVVVAGSPSAALHVMETLPPASDVEAKARSYIASKVGDAYAAAHYVLARTECWQSKDVETGSIASSFCNVGFRYDSLAKIGAPEVLVTVFVPVGGIRPVSGFVGSTGPDGKVLEPVVARSEAEARFRAAAPGEPPRQPASLRLPYDGSDGSPYWSATFPITANASCWTDREGRIDAVTGRLWFEPDSTACE